jgi:PAS domain S-box-containing protein
MFSGEKTDAGQHPRDTNRLILAALIPLAAFVLQWIFWAAIQPYVWFLFYPAVFISSWIGGKRAGLVATAFSTVVVWWFFMPQRYSFVLERPTSAIAIGLFACMGVLFSLTHDRLRKANQQAAEALAAVNNAKDQLEVQVSERTAELAQTIAALRASEEKYRLIAENSEDWIYWIAPDGKLPYISPSCERMTGYSLAEFADNTHLITEMVHPEDRAKFLHHSENLREESKPYSLEYRVITKTSETLWISHSCAPLFTPDGGYAGRRGTNRNITERKRAETALRESNSLLRVAGRMARFGGWKVNLADGKQTWSDEVARIHDELPGYSPSAVKDGINYYAPEWREKITAVFGDCVRDGKPYDEEMQIVTARGRRVWVRTIGEAVRDAAGAIIQVHGAFQNITERKQAEEALQESEERMRLLGDNLPDSYVYQYIYEAEGTPRFLYLSAGVESLHGVSREDVLRDAALLHQQVDSEQMSTLMTMEAASLQSMSDFRMELRMCRADGEWRWMQIRSRPRRKPDGQVLWDGVATDITERKRAEDEVLASKMQLEAALASMSDAVFISDTEGRFIEFNDAFATFHKFRSKDECAKTFAEYPEILDVFMSNGELAPVEQWAVPRALRGETATNAEYTLRRKDTGETWVGNYSFAPIRNKDGVIVG